MSAAQVIRMAADVDRLVPEIDIHALAFLIDCWMREEVVYDKNKGVQNVLTGIRRIQKLEGGGYKVKQEYTW